MKKENEHANCHPIRADHVPSIDFDGLAGFWLMEQKSAVSRAVRGVDRRIERGKVLLGGR